MTKTLKDLFELYVATSTKNDKDFLSPQHTVQKHADRNGNGDDVFTGSNVKTAKRAPEHGYDADDDVKAHISKNSVPKEQGHVREEVEQIDEGTAKDGYWVTNHETKLTHEKPFRDSKEAIRHADKEEDRTGRVHTVSHVKGGKVKKQWQYQSHTGDASGWIPYTENKDEDFYHAGLKEEVEQIDERNKENKLKKDIFTVKAGQKEVARGINFARYQSGTLADRKGHDYGIVNPDDDEEFSKHASRKTAIRTYKVAGRNAMKEEVEQIDELKKGDWVVHSGGKVGQVHNVSGDNASVDVKWNKSGKITSHEPTSLKKLHEEVEQIDELSKSSVRSYLNKSDKDLDDTLLTKAGTPKPKISDEDSHRVSKRLKGGAMASKRLYTAEDTDVVESAFNRYVAGKTDAAPRKSRLEENLAVVAPKTRTSILAMYETLSVENQDIMLDLSESIEGINELVDFVITNGEL